MEDKYMFIVSTLIEEGAQNEAPQTTKKRG
jgi:hypothetical protein